MTNGDLVGLRSILKLNQTEMAKRMGLSMRAYQEIEAADGELKLRHQLAAERVALTRAIELNNPMMAPANIRREAADLYRLLMG